MKERPFAHCLKAMANPLRIQALRELEKGPSSVLDLCSSLKEEQSMVSHALQQLRRCHLVDVKTVGKQRIYSLSACMDDAFSGRKKGTQLYHFLYEHRADCCNNQCPRLHHASDAAE
jgi:DNA-binding transcriptional ArsR family regulator